MSGECDWCRGINPEDPLYLCPRHEAEHDGETDERLDHEQA